MDKDIVASQMENILHDLRSHMAPVRLTEDGVLCDLLMPEGYYTGETRNGLRHGKGTMHYSDGKTCTGDWANGQANGEVEFKSKDGKIIYKGQMVNGLANGKGVMVNTRSRQYYEGEFKDSLYHGYGKLYKANNELLYEGFWENGKQTGHGTSYVGGKRSYVGDWKNGRPDGQGTSFSEDGAILYSGTWKEGGAVDKDSRIDKAAKEAMNNNKTK